MNVPNTIYDYIKTEETNYALPVQVIDQWEWSMKEHIKLSVLYKNSVYSTGKDDQKPFKNITRPILNLQYRAEGFDVKDIEMFVDDARYYYKSLVIRKFHEKWAREHGLDDFIDEMVESYIDFGGALVKNVNQIKPEVIPLQSIAFCDQTDILSGPIAIKHFYSPDQLLDMEEYGWGKPENNATVTLEELIILAQNEKIKDSQDGKTTKTPGKYIEIYEVHGNLPEKFIGEKNSDSEKYCSQMQIVAFYTDKEGKSQGVTLFSGKEKESIFKLILRDDIYGRALGLGGAEELFEPQVWVNYDIIRIKEMLDEAAKIIYKTTDGSFAKRNNTKDLETGEILTLADGTDIGQVDNFPRNISMFEKSISDWEAHAQQMGSASDAIMGESPKSGTPFKLQELVTNNSQGLHDYRRGKLSTFLDGIYKDWIIPHLKTEIVNEQKFLAELDVKEMQTIADAITEKKVNEGVMETILNGDIPNAEDIELARTESREKFLSGDNKKFFKIFKDEMKDVAVDVRVNIAGKQEYMRERVDKLVNVFRQVLGNPAALAEPAMADLFNKIIESSGLEQIDFSGIKAPEQAPQQAPQEQAPQDVVL
ncbi:MAG: hypothetical protein DRJ64_02670 [Thermoprotei archaeon]|nr:MAG: hypothetical protein DRJ64_02670 [Thermoprotei archaeon]